MPFYAVPWLGCAARFTSKGPRMTLKSRSLLLSALIASPLLLAFDLRGDALSFHPESGVSVE